MNYEDYDAMSLEELRNELRKLMDSDFYLEMKDHWSSEDYEWSRTLHNDIQYVQNKIDKMI